MSDLQHFGSSIFGPDKDVCQTCGNESSTHNWRDGVCKSCQQKKSIDITKPYLMWLSAFIFIVAIFELCLNLATLGYYSKWMRPNTLTTRLGKYIVRKQLE
jgi:hypothetical protein